MNSLNCFAIQDMHIWDAEHRMPQFIIQLILKRKQQTTEAINKRWVIVMSGLKFCKQLDVCFHEGRFELNINVLHCDSVILSKYDFVVCFLFSQEPSWFKGLPYCIIYFWCNYEKTCLFWKFFFIIINRKYEYWYIKLINHN